MRKQITTFAVIALVLLIYPMSLSSQNNFSLSLDANGASGNQASTSLNTSADQVVSIQIFGTNIQNAKSLSARFEYDESQVVYEGFDAGDVLPGAQVLPEQGTNPTYVEIGMGALGGQATVNSGWVGTVRFRTTAAFSGTAIRLVRGVLGRSGQLETVTLTARVELQPGSVAPSPDFDGDGVVGIPDFLLFVNQFGSSQGDGTYQAKYDLDSNGVIGIPDFLIFINDFGTGGEGGGGGGGGGGSPDLIVESPSVSDDTLTSGQSFTLGTTVRNQGNGQSAATTLRYYRSADATITINDTSVGTDAVGSLSASGTSSESINLQAPNTAGFYYYGACIESVSGESNTQNNCSSGVRVTVANSNTFDAIVAQIKNLETKLEQNRNRIEQEITQQRQNHPLNAPKGEFETDEEYADRQSQLNAILAESRQRLLVRYGIKNTQTQIAQLYRKTFPTNDITATLGEYDADGEYYPVTFEVTLNREDRRYDGRLTINRDDARNLRDNWSRVIKTGYLSIDPVYRQALAWIRLEYTPFWPRGLWWSLNEVYHLGDNNLSITFRPDGTYIATANGRNRMATLWDMSNGQMVRQIEHGPRSADYVYAVAFSPDGRYLVTGGEDAARHSSYGKTVLWDMNSGRKIWQVEQNDEVDILTFSPDGRYLATITRPHSSLGRMVLWDINSSRSIRSITYNAYSSTIYALAFSPDGKFIATGNYRDHSSYLDRATIWDVRTGKVVQQIEHTGVVNTVAFSPDGQYLATGGYLRRGIDEGVVILWERNNAQLQEVGQSLLQVEHKTHIRFIAFSPDGKYLAVGDHDRIITIYRVPTGEITFTTKMSIEKTIRTSSEIRALVWNPDGRFISDSKKVYRVIPRPDIQED